MSAEHDTRASDEPGPGLRAVMALLDPLDAIAVQGYRLDRRLFYWNRASQALYGWSADEVAGRPVEQVIIAPAERQAFVDLHETWLAEGHAAVPAREYACVHRDGHALPVLATQVRVHDAAAGDRVFCLDLDLGERRRTEAELAQIRDHLEAALAGTNDGIWDWDIAGGRIYYSPRFRELLGYDDEARFAREFDFRPALHPDDLRRTGELLDAHLRGDTPTFDADYRLRRADGSWRWFHGRGRARRDGQGHTTRFAGAIIDITERVLAQQALRRSEDRFRALVNLSADWYWQTDAQHRFTRLEGGSALPAGPASAYLGRCRWDLYADQMPAQDWTDHRRMLDQHLPFRDFELRRIDADGRRQVFVTSGEPLFDEQGRFEGYHGVGRDLSAVHQARQAQLAAEQQLRSAQRLEALGTLAGGIAHDFNNVLGALLGTLQMARADAGRGLPVTTHLAQIERSAHRARDLVARILTFSRQRPTDLTTMPLQGLVEEAAALLRATLPPTVRLELRLPAEPVHARVDASQIHQVLMNLVINAWQAIGPRPGAIEIGLASEQAPEGDRARVWVSDDGIGMDEATRQRVFEPFFTTKPVDQGTGLGLSMVHGIVAAHGGRVAVASAPGQGATFSVFLPRVAAQAPLPPTPAPAPALQGGGRGERLCLVDDDDVVRLVAAEVLQRAGYQVRAFAAARPALDWLESAQGAVDLIVTDHNMPELSGLELARRVERLPRRPPVVVVSGYLDEPLREAARRHGVVGFVQKERLVEDLLPCVRQALSSPP